MMVSPDFRPKSLICDGDTYMSSGEGLKIVVIGRTEESVAVGHNLQHSLADDLAGEDLLLLIPGVAALARLLAIMRRVRATRARGFPPRPSRLRRRPHPRHPSRRELCVRAAWARLQASAAGTSASSAAARSSAAAAGPILGHHYAYALRRTLARRLVLLDADTLLMRGRRLPCAAARRPSRRQPHPRFSEAATAAAESSAAESSPCGGHLGYAAMRSFFSMSKSVIPPEPYRFRAVRLWSYR